MFKVIVTSFYLSAETRASFKYEQDCQLFVTRVMREWLLQESGRTVAVYKGRKLLRTYFIRFEDNRLVYTCHGQGTGCELFEV